MTPPKQPRYRTPHRPFSSHRSPPLPRSRPPLILTSSLILASSAAAAAVYLSSPLRAEEKVGQAQDVRKKEVDVTTTDWRQQSQLHRGDENKHLFLWGSNRYNVTAPEADSEVVKKPTRSAFFQGAVLRDLALHETYAVAVDVKGDVYQWGDGFTSPPNSDSDSPPQPHLTLRGLDIRRVACTPSKIYALSRSGSLYVLPSSSALQALSPSDPESQPDRVKGSWWPTWLWGRPDPGVDVVEIKTLPEGVRLARGERIASISAGTDHLLALTSQNRVFSVPASLRANTHGQLGIKNVVLRGGRKAELVPTALDDYEETVRPPTLDPNNLPRALAWLSDVRTRPGASSSLADEPATPVIQTNPSTTSVTDDGSLDIRFCTTLHELPSLRSVPIEQLACGSRHSLFLTSSGEALSLGGNFYGQLGVGPLLAFPALLAPTEVDWQRSYPGKKELVKCKGLAAGGNSSYWVVERTERRTGKKRVDVVSAGQGQFGGAGNGLWSHQGSPVRVKTVSGLQEWSDVEGAILPIDIHSISVGNTHVAAVLDNAVTQKDIAFGRDVFIWGHNADFQLGTGKRSNLSIPQHLPPLPYPKSAKALSAKGEHAELISGTDSPMPHNRMQLSPRRRWRRGVEVEETVVAGWHTTGVYWRVVD